MEFRDLFIAFTLVALFMFCMISFSINLSSDNEANSSIISHPIINDTYSKLEANLSTFRATAEGQRGGFESELPSAGFGELIIFAVIGAGKILTESVVALFNIVFGSLSSVIGISPIVIGVFTSILLFTLIFLAWKLYKQGQ